MDGGALRERLRRARAACGEELSTLSRRTGIRLQHLRAIEDGRFGDLPPGIYGRSAVRAFAEACGLDSAEVLADCEPLLPRVADPIDALARKCGVPASKVIARSVAALADGDARVSWRTLAAPAIDAAFIGAILTAVIGSAAFFAGVPIHAVARAALPLAIVGIVQGIGYFAWFGGLCGTTLGGLLMHASHARDREPLTLETIASRAWSAATDDARAILRLGVRSRQGAATLGALSRSARPPEPSLWPLRLRGRAPVLWLPENRPAVAPPPTPHPRQG
jgi:Helix-turn-helix domain